ncbi:MAG: DUF262 domain-containing protein [Bryobacterales bacterium]|nr:DUF262 domain-containing protein [Bryobacterales bacterium]
MKDAQKPGHVSLTVLIDRLREGCYVIPDFQREFEWTPWDIRELIRSIFLDYYIGNVLLWKGTDRSFNDLACEPLYGFQGSGDPTHIVLDGQQRLTAMYYAFLAPDVPAPSRKNRFLYFIRVDQFLKENYDQSFEYDWKRSAGNLLQNRTDQFENHMFPLAVVGDGSWALVRWVDDYKKHWLDKEAQAENKGDEAESLLANQHVENAQAFGEHLEGITVKYQIAFIELDQDIQIDKVCGIFTQINRRGRPLDVFDLINALLKPKEIQLKHLWRAAKPKLDFVETNRMNRYILQVMSILRQTYCSPKYLYYLVPGVEKNVRSADGSLRKEILVCSPEEFQEWWDIAVDALKRAIDLLRHPQEFGAISSRYLPYASILPAFAAIQSAARQQPMNRQFDALRKLRYWYWVSVFTNRYSGSVESTSARDFLELKNWFEDETAKPVLISDFNSRFLSIDFRRETRRGTSIYNGIFNLLVLHGARDWMTGNVPQHDDLDDHHIVPKKWRKEHTHDTSIDTILNRTPLTADTNRKAIRDRLPNEYIPELVKEHGEVTVRKTLESHYISRTGFDILLRDPFTSADYESFLEERQRTLQNAISERLDLPPQLRELDAQVE